MITVHNTRAMSHLHTLVNEIGARPAGTPAHHKAESYIREVFRKAQLEIEEVRVDFPHWSLHEASMLHEGQSLKIDVNPFSPPIHITASIVAISTLPQLEAASIKGKIVLLYGELSKAPIFPMNFAPVQFERDQTINRLLVDKQPAAVLAVNLHPWRRVHIFEDEDFPIPSATVSVDVGRTLLAHIGEDIHLLIDTVTEQSQVTTLVGHNANTERHRIVLCAHYDTKVGTPGASDNGTGMAVLLALAESVSQLDLSVGVDFVAWADEEYGAHTDSAYAASMGDSFADILCAINMDGIGLVTENTTLTMLEQSAKFEQEVRRVIENYSGVVWVDPWIQSNHATYAMRGVPSIALSSLTWERSHQSDDTSDWISPTKLQEVSELVTDIITVLDGHLPSWSRA